MKCPKCGYNSFEFHDACKKCANDLTSYKDTYGLKPIVLPLEARMSMAEKLMAETALSDQKPDTSDTSADMFSFDVPEDKTAQAVVDDPFNFDDEPIPAAKSGGEFSFDDGQQSAQAKAEEDAFADLLESTSQEAKAPAAAASAAPAAGSTEMELSNFSWDDTPAPAPGETAKPAEDDFNSLFGSMDEPAKK